jgi:uncharacterized protein with HEPN domain
MYPSILELIKHIADETEFCLKEMRHLSYDQFIQDEKLMRAVVRGLEIIGEASKKVPDDFKIAHADVEWKSMAGMRDRLIHNYFGVDYEMVYKTVKNDLPKLNEWISTIL